jgi:hypothetical protein
MRSRPPAQCIPTLPDRRLSDSALPAIVNFDETPDLSSSLVPVSEIAAFLLPGRFSLGRCFGDDHLAPLIPSSGAFFLLRTRQSRPGTSCLPASGRFPKIPGIRASPLWHVLCTASRVGQESADKRARTGEQCP